jgi:parallel beta-helix repeat protein
MERLNTGVLVCLLFLGAGVALGQYSGTYTIMPSGGDFASHAEAAESLMTYGVVGPCTLLMYTGTYTGQAFFDNAPWDSVEVMFKAAPGESVAVENSSYPWYIYYTDNITVDGIATSTNASYAYYIYYSHNTQVRNQTIGASSYGCYAYRSPSTIFENCNVSVGSYGLYFYYSDSCRATGNRIRAGSYGIRWYYSGMRYCVGNNITSGGSYGIYAYRNASGSYSYYDTIAVNMMNGSNYGIYHYYHRNSYVYGNTFYGGSYAYYSYYGYGESFYNNIFLSGGTYPLYKSGGGPPAGCDYNCYWPDPRPIFQSGFGAISLDQWRHQTDQDSHSIYRDPLVGGPTNLHLRPGSPCVDSGMENAGFPLDIDGDTIRNGIRDIGADEYAGVGGPMSGTYLIHQDPDSGDYSSFAEACHDLVLRGTAAPCTFDVAAGTYSEQVAITDFGDYWVTFQSRFYGTDSMEEATIQSGSHAVNMTAAEYIALQGFNLIAGGSCNGVRMYYSGSDYTRWCVVRDNCINAYYGVYMYYANHCSIIGNRFPASGYYGVYAYYAHANTFINNMFSSTGYGMYTYQNDSTKLIYNSIAGEYYGLYDHYGYYETMYDNIFWGRSCHGWYKEYGNACPLASDYNCFWAGYQPAVIYHSSYGAITLAEWQTYSGMDLNSIARDPEFVSFTDLHLRRESPCRDSGVAIRGITTDIDGDRRDLTPCIGADEWRDPGGPMSGVYYIHPHSDSGNFVSFLEALDTLGQRGFGGDVTLLAFSGTYIGDVEIEGLGNDNFKLTLGAVEGESPVVQAEGQSTPAVSLTSARNVIVKGLTMNGYYGLRMYYTGNDSGCQNCSIAGNNINGSYYGTYIYRGCNNVFAGNIVRTSGYYGLYWYGYPEGSMHDNYVYNNMVISSYGYGYGAYFYYHDGLHFLYNSMLGKWYYSLYLYCSDNCQLRNNTLCNAINSPSYPVARLDMCDSLRSDYNCWWPGDSLGPVINGMTLEEWREFSGQDSHSIQLDPLFVSETDLHLQAMSPCIDIGTPIPGIIDDIDGELRDSTPCIGADEWVGTGLAEGTSKPLVVDLFRPAPNPASGPVRIRWQVPTLCPVSLKAYDISGRCVNTLVDRMVETGVYVTVWHGRDNLGRRLAPGIYFCTLETKDKKLTHKVVLTSVR